jgi:NAD(P)-dependent dehydrogenase (short-subunit alcohol dehydrogenase family)
MATNITASWFLTRTIFPHMAKGGASRVLFISSGGAGWAFTPGFGPYNVSKAALNNLGANMAAECAARHPGLNKQTETTTLSGKVISPTYEF